MNLWWEKGPKLAANSARRAAFVLAPGVSPGWACITIRAPEGRHNSVSAASVPRKLGAVCDNRDPSTARPTRGPQRAPHLREGVASRKRGGSEILCHRSLRMTAWKAVDREDCRKHERASPACGTKNLSPAPRCWVSVI